MDEITGIGFKLNLVKQDVLRVEVVPDVPNAVKQFNVQLTVLVACHVDGGEHVNFVLEGDGTVGHIEHGFHRHGVDRRHKRQGYIGGLRDVQGQRDVQDFPGDEGGFVEVVPPVVVHVTSVVVVADWNGSVGEVSVFIGVDHHGEFLAKVHVNKLDGLVGHDITVHVSQGVLEDGSWHVHVEVVAWLNPNFNRVWKQDFLSVGQLGDHVVGARKESGLVERTGFNHGPREGPDTDKQSGAVEGSSPFEESGSFERLSLRGFRVSVGTAQCGGSLGREGTEGFHGALQSIGRRVAVRDETQRLVGGHDGVGFVVFFTIIHVGGIDP